MSDDKQYVKAFNYGYYMQKHEPNLAGTLLKGITNKEQEYMQGFIKGLEKYREERLEKYLDDERVAQKNYQKIKTKERNRDM